MIPLSTPPGTKIVAIRSGSTLGVTYREGETYTLADWFMCEQLRRPGMVLREIDPNVTLLDGRRARILCDPANFRLPVTLESLMANKARAPEDPKRARKPAR